jgi:hypothetical protein
MDEPEPIQVVMSVPSIEGYSPSICISPEEHYARLVDEYPGYHFFLMEVRV